MWLFSYNNKEEEESVGYGRSKQSRQRPPEIEGMVRYEITKSDDGIQSITFIASAHALASEGGLDNDQLDRESSLQRNNSKGSVPPQTEVDSHGVPINNHRRGFRIITWNPQSLPSNPKLEPRVIQNGQVVLPFGLGLNPNSETFKTFQVQTVRYSKNYKTRRYRQCCISINDVALER